MKSISTTDEKELLRRLRDGNAFEQFYYLYSKRIFINILKMVKDEEQAQDILQDLFIKLWNHREYIDPDKSFQSYLFSAAQNLVRDFFRKAALDLKMQAVLIARSTELYEHIESDLYFRESDALVQQAIDALPLQRKRIYTLCKLEGKSYDEVSIILGVTVSTVGNQLVKAKRSIQDYLYAYQNIITILAGWLIGRY